MSAPFPADAWQGRRVFITGHTGFKGSWLALWLNVAGARVTGYALAPPTSPNHFHAADIGHVLESHCEADIRDADALEKALRACDPDVVFHLAAQSLVRESYAQPRETFEVNVIGTVCLLDGIRRLGRPCVVVVVTSDKCYENREQEAAYRETDRMGGRDPYSASKGATELLAACYRDSYFDPRRLREHGVKLASARSGNVIGGGDWARDRIVPDLVTHWARNEKAPVRNPAAVRPWQHVLEPLSGYILLAERMLASDDSKWCSAWNFGPLPEDGATVRELVEMLSAEWEGAKWRDAGDAGQPHEAGLLRLNIEKAVAELGWRPRWKLGEAVRRTADWYRRYYEGGGASVREASLSDIEAYCRTEISG